MCKFRNYDNYEIYSDGRIYSYKTKKFLKPQTQKNGYQVVNLYDNDGKMKCYLLHRVVWEAVTGEPIPEHLEVNHRSEDKAENSFSNLELLSHKQNINYGTGISRRAKTHSKALKGIIPKANPPKSVGAFQNGELIFTFPSIAEAQRNGFNQGAVSECCRNCFNRQGNNIYKGYEWRYINEKET